jgi:hypothetical protein
MSALNVYKPEDRILVLPKIFPGLVSGVDQDFE